MRVRLLLGAAALGVALAGCGSSVAAPATPSTTQPPAYVPATTVPIECQISYDCSGNPTHLYPSPAPPISAYAPISVPPPNVYNVSGGNQ